MDAASVTADAPPTALDRLTAAVTAFRTWAELLECMRRGYCPTLRPESRRQRLLAKTVRAAGFPYFDGRRVVRPAAPVRGRNSDF